MINAQALGKRFMVSQRGWRRASQEVVALDGVGFSAADGEITGLLGPNGAGKTTLMRILATVVKPDSGSAWIDGHDVVADARSARRRLGVLGDAKGLYPRLTARENICYFGQLQGMERQAAEAAAARLIEELGMQRIADRSVEGFSQGERMKTALARSLVHGPQTVILDEPTNGLDILATRTTREMILALKARGRCVLFSSHIMQEVEALCDRLVIVNHGRLIASGTPTEILDQSGRDTLEDALMTLLGHEAEGVTRA
ncbi:ABC transporter ATP-binding protein [Chitinimonas lacunae]|uniref:ATP-binding cassette domain-containing protein n=1 Tax=Chitinimonas lacunae TaxID=1963018 RepID=A0ABV8MNA8_9NEIS